MITIDQNKCNTCGLCVKICHESCMLIENGLLTIDYKYCSTCTQCIAVCPQQALSWDNHMPELFDKSSYPDPEQVGELFRERRTIRDYTNRKIDRSILEEIAGYAIYGTITMGYPAIKFRNKVSGKHISIQWNTIKN